MDRNFENHLRKLEDPNYEEETNFILPENANLLERSKYEICQKILAYKQEYGLTTEQIAKKIKLSVPKTEEILLANLDKLTLDRLMVYVGEIFYPSEVKLTIKQISSNV